MKIWTSPYQLYPKGVTESSSPRLRKGCLLKIEFSDGIVGYADLCPFVNYGDEPLGHQLVKLKNGGSTSLLERSLSCARWDAEARSEKRSLLSSMSLKNHFLISDLLNFDLNRIPALQSDSYSEFKIKMGHELVLETSMLEELIRRLGAESRLRLDFNARLSFQDFDNWLQTIGDWLLPKVEFVEDPFPYDPKTWSHIQNQYGLRLAIDFEVKRATERALPGVAVVVVKPAVQDFQYLRSQFDLKDRGLVFTHYMDFPLGQMFAMATVQDLIQQESLPTLSCGLQHQEHYELFEFQELIHNRGPFVEPPKGLGLGFDEALAVQDWHRLI